MKAFLLMLLSFHIFVNDVSANTNVQISIQPSNVANLYYQIVNHGQPIYDELEFYLVDDTGHEYRIQANQSILLLENVPFGKYELVLKNSSYTNQIIINRNYLKTQHILKKIEITNQNMTPDTSDSYHIYLFLFILGILFLMFLLLFIQKS